MEVAIIYNKSNTFGLSQDAEVFQYLLKSVDAGKVRVRTVDPLEPPVAVSVAIHLEVPYYGWMPYATTNYLLLNPEWYEVEAWESYLKHMDGVFFRDTLSKQRFQEKYPEVKTFYLPWCVAPDSINSKAPQSLAGTDGFVWFLGGSVNKRAFAAQLLPRWKADYAKLTVYTTKALEGLGSLAENVTIKVQDLDPDQRKTLAAWYPGHLCLSQAEAFGYTAAEAEANGALLVVNDLEVYTELYKDSSSVHLLPTKKESQGLATKAIFEFTEDFRWGLEKANMILPTLDMKKVRQGQKEKAEQRRKAAVNTFFDVWIDVRRLVSERKSSVPKHLPPVLAAEDCPPISVVTLLYNRRKFFDLACHNIILSDYPKNKIEWVIVEDSDDPNESASDRVIQVGLKSAPVQVVYVPYEKKLPISEKRNVGVNRAKNDIILFMDDDDHYPETSFRRRVAWLTKHPWKPQCTACTTIAAYDLIRGVSAVNTPPWSLPLKQRISEATLTFYKSWWQTQKFPMKTDMAEGEKFLEGREHEVLEMPPQQVIVAFSHKKNTSGRRIPADDAKPGCFWGFPKEFLIYIHKLAGIEVEEEK